MRKLATAAIVAAALAMVMSGAALWRTRHLSSSKANPGVSTQSDAGQVTVPDMVNKNAFQAGAALATVKLKYKVVKVPSATVAKALVISQNPAAGTVVPLGTEIELTASTGP